LLDDYNNVFTDELHTVALAFEIGIEVPDEEDELELLDDY